MDKPKMSGIMKKIFSLPPVPTLLIVIPSLINLSGLVHWQFTIFCLQLCVFLFCVM